MASVQPKTVAKVQNSNTVTKIWNLKNWKEFHNVLALQSSCYVDIGNANLRFFLRPNKKEFQSNGDAITMNYYSLWVELISGPAELIVGLKTNLKPVYPWDYNDEMIGASIKRGSFVVTEKTRELLACENLIYMGGNHIDLNNMQCFENPASITKYHSHTPELTITLSVTRCDLVQTHIGNQARGKTAPDDMESTNIAHQMKSLLIDPQYNMMYDVKLKMRDGIVLEAHKAILAARSSVFLAMFTTEMRESTENLVEISDIGSEAMKVILHFVYADAVHENWRLNVTEVVYAAGKYNLPKLLHFFNVNLITVCSRNNAIELFKLAKLYRLETAMEQLTEFTRSNTAEVLLGMEFE